MAKILITNGGPHPAEKWAMATAEEIFDTNSMAAGDRSIQAQKFQLKIAEILAPHHERVQSDEQAKLRKDVKSISTPHDASPYVEGVVEDVVAASKGTPWQEHFAKAEIQEAVGNVVTNHIMSSQHVERLWHAERNPNCPVSQAYKTQFMGGNN